MSDYISRGGTYRQGGAGEDGDQPRERVEAREMKCKWYAAFEGVCTNGECPYRGDTCPTSEHPEVCKYVEYAEKQPEIPQLSVEELAKTLRLCGSASCRGCAFSEASDCGNIILSQAADMLEKLSKDVVPKDFHERCVELEIQKRIAAETEKKTDG